MTTTRSTATTAIVVTASVENTEQWNKCRNCLLKDISDVVMEMIFEYLVALDLAEIAPMNSNSRIRLSATRLYHTDSWTMELLMMRGVNIRELRNNRVCVCYHLETSGMSVGVP